jgi:hypothetical protein
MLEGINVIVVNISVVLECKNTLLFMRYLNLNIFKKLADFCSTIQYQKSAPLVIEVSVKCVCGLCGR